MKHRSMTVLRAGMLLLSATLFGALVWLLWQTVPWAAVRWGILGLCAAIMAAGTVLCLAIPAQLMGLFTQNPESIRAGAEALRIISAGFLVSSVSVAAGGALEGLGKGGPSLVISLLRYTLVMIPAAWLLSRLIGPAGVWHAFWLSEAVTALLSILIYRRSVR